MSEEPSMFTQEMMERLSFPALAMLAVDRFVNDTAEDSDTEIDTSSLMITEFAYSPELIKATITDVSSTVKFVVVTVDVFASVNILRYDFKLRGRISSDAQPEESEDL